MFKHIMLATDGSKLSRKAANKAVEMARALGARMTAAHVVRPYHAEYASEGFVSPQLRQIEKRYTADAVERSAKILNAVKTSAEKSGVQCDVVTVSGDSPYEALIKQAGKSACDLMVMASHGRRGLQGFLLGSETHKLLTHSKIPVLVCR
jgi:nucleotide-binding universal stress UspA family protein